MAAAHEFVVLTTTVATRAEADSLARALVEARLAACIQIVAVDSVYAWHGNTEQAAEQLLIIKIRFADFAATETRIREQHTYEMPEIIAVPLVAGSDSYLSWLSASTAR